MFVYGSLDMAGLEVLSTLPVTDVFIGRIVKVGDQVFVYGAGGWSTVSVPPINDPLIEGQILSNDGVKPIWVEQYPDMLTHDNHVLRTDGLETVFWDPQYPPMGGHEDDILHSDGIDGVYWKPQYPDMTGHTNDILHSDGINEVYWTPQYPDMTGHQFHVLVNDGIDQAYWTPQYPDMTGLTNWILRTNGIDYVFWDAQYPDQTGHVGKFLQTDGNNTVAWAFPPSEVAPMALKQDWLLSNNGTSTFWTADPSAALPGQFLLWDGAAHVWADPPGLLPAQAGFANNILLTDGTAPFWGADPSLATPGQVLTWDGTLHVWTSPPTGIPDLTGKQNWLLTNDGLAPVWTADPTLATPGQFLQWDGAGHVWVSLPITLPDQTGHAGEYLTTDGFDAGWAPVARSGLSLGNVNYVVINDGTGAMTDEAFLNQSRGGFGQDVTGFSGFVQAGPAGQFFAAPLQPGDMPTGIDASDISSGLVDNAMFDRVAGLGRYEASSIIEGGVLSVNANPATFDISAGNGLIIDYVTTPATPIITPVTWGAQTAVVITGLAINDLTYLLMNAAGALSQQSTFPTPVQLRDNIYIGLIVHSNHSSITYINSVGNHNESLGNQFFDFMNAVGPFNVVGNTITPNGANLTFQKAAGLMFSAYYNQVATPKNPHIVQNFQAIPASFAYRTQLGGTTGNVTDIDPHTWDNGGTLQAVGGTANATVQRVFLFPNNLIRVQYGQKVYPNLANALNEMGYEAFVTAPSVRGLGILIGYIVAQNNATDLSNTTKARIINAARFDVGPAAGSLATTDIQIAYENSGFPVLVLNGGIGTFGIRDAATPLAQDLFSVASNDGLTKYLEVDSQGLKTSNVLPNLALISNSDGAIASLPGVSSLEMSYLDGVLGPIQDQLDAKAVIGGSLAQFGPTTSAELAGVISDEIGTGLLVFNNTPLLLSPWIDNGASFLHETTPIAPAPGQSLLYPKADNKWYTKDSSNNELPVGGGLLPLAIAAGPVTASPGTHYLTDTTAGAFTITLPAGSAGASLKFTDAAETWGTNNLTIVPATGQKIDMLAINETLVCDVVRGWVELNWNGTYWVFGSLASTSIGEASGTAAGIVSIGTQSFAGNKTFLGSITPSGGIVGSTSGIAPALGMLGEKITWVTPPTNTALTTTEADWANAFITVTAGTWLIFANIPTSYDTGTTAGNLGASIVRLTDASNNVIQNNDRQVAVQTPSAAKASVMATTSMSATVTVGSSTVYKIRAFRSDGVGVGVGNIFNTSTARADFFAVRIGS